MLFVDSDVEEDFDDDQSEQGSDDAVDKESVDVDDDKGSSEESGDDGPGKVSKKKKKRKRQTKDKNGKISKKEEQELKEKEHTYESNLYRAQIEELLHEVGIGIQLKKEALEWFQDFKSFIKKSKPSKEFQIRDADKLIEEIKLPLPNYHYIKTPLDSTDTVKWSPPTNIKMVGSWPSNVAVSKISCVDILMELPMAYFRKKDFLNHRYHIKRAIYLAYIAKLLSKRGDTVSFILQQGNPIKPAIIIQCEHFSVKIITTVSEIFKASRLGHDVNNLRFEHFFQRGKSEDDPELSTPNYNFSILTDLSVEDSQTSVHSIIQKCDAYCKALQLLKVWLHQRNLSQGFGGFSGFIASAYLVYLSSLGKIDSFMSAYDIIRNFFKYLSKEDWTTDGISFNPSKEIIKDWMLQFEVVFLDKSGHVNYTSDMSKFTFKRVQNEAKLALAVLEKSKLVGFQAIFLTPVPFIQNFDHILQLSEIDISKALENENQGLLNHSGYQFPVAVFVFGQLIEKCLANRVQLIDLQLPEEKSWNVNNYPPNLNCGVLRFGLIISREAAYKLVEKCETEDLNDNRAESFKKLWGSKSQLRRFKDGTMCETVVFEEKKRILFQMMSYVFQTHLQFSPTTNGMNYIDCQIDDVIEKGFLTIKKNQKTPQKTVFLKGKRKKPSITELNTQVPIELDSISNSASLAFDDLSKVLRSIEGLPLEVSAVQGTSPILRFASVHPTPPQSFPVAKWLAEIEPEVHAAKIVKKETGSLPKMPKVVEPITVILHLETSGKWPEDISAVDRLKCAFLIRIGQHLNNQFGFTVQPHSQFLDVLKDGFIFRIKLTYYRELTLLKEYLGADGVLKIRDNPQSLRLEKETLLLPQLTTTLHSFHLQFEAFGKTVRMAKRWMASQLLLASPISYCNNNLEQPDCRFTEESIELLVAHVFMSFAPHLSPPNEAQTGLLRFLFLMSTCSWKATPIVLNFHEKLTSEDVSAIELDFVKRRSQLPPLFIATPEDKSSSVWTKSLAVIVLYRAQLLAQEALKVLQSCLLGHSSVACEKSALKIRKVFRADTEGFDVLIHLKKSMNPTSCDNIDSTSVPKYHQYIKNNKETIPIMQFDPVQIFLSELRSSFGHLALFLHNTYGGHFIAIVWKSEAFKEYEFSATHINTGRLSMDKKIATEVEEVIESIRLLGAGIIESIERK